MKLENFHRVQGLVKRREYIRTLNVNLRLNEPIKIGRLDVDPKLIEKMRPELCMLFEQQIAVVDEDLAKLGVITKDAA